MMGLLHGKVAVITGSTRGLGFGIAEAFAREGAAVVISSRSAEAVARASAALREAGHQRVSGIPCDVSDLAQVEALGAHAVSTFGRIDIWVNNAALSAPYGPTVLVEPPDFQRVIRANIDGTYHGSVVALRQMLQQRSGKLINLMGYGDRKPAPLQSAYGSSKTWVRNFTLALAKENKDSGVGIFAFNPGMVETELLMAPTAVPGYEDRLKVLPTLIRMWGNPPAVPARRAVWLASAATDGRTGLEVRVLGPGRMLSGLLREGWRRIIGR